MPVLVVLLLLFHLEQISSPLPEAELLTRAISGKASGQEGAGSIGARVTQATSVQPLANLVPPLKTPNSPLLLTLDLSLTLLLW